MTLEVVSPTAALLDGRYLLHDRVGRGGMATVYRADDTHLGRTVAIKMIHEDQGPVASIERAHTEKALLATLSHPSLVTLHDAQLTPGRPQYLVMEFVDGPTLAERMSAGALPPRDVARLLRDLADGLAAVHAAGIVHRDVKPSNVLLARGNAERPFAAKLADFGIATSLGSSRLTTPGIVLGTLTYMAPEQLRDAEPGTPVDIFSLGLVIIEALSGEPGYPSLGSSRAAAVARLMNAPKMSEAVPEEWRELLAQMTRLDPDERPEATEVAATARRLLASESKTSTAAKATSTDDAAAAGGASATGITSTAADTPGTAAGITSTVAHTADTAILPAVASTRPRRRRRMIVGAAAAVAAGVLVAGMAIATSVPDDAGRRVSATAVRAAVPAEPADTTDTSDTSAETVADQGASDQADKPDKAEKADKAEKPDKSGSSGKSDNSSSNGKAPKKADG